MEVLKFVIEYGADLNANHPLMNDRHRRKGECLSNTPLDCAARSGTPKIIQLLLENGAILERSAAVHSAAGSRSSGDNMRRLRNVEFLLDLGMDVNRIESEGDPDFYERYRNFNFATPLHYAAYWNKLETVQYLLERGANKNVLSTKGESALEWASGNRNKELIELLSS